MVNLASQSQTHTRKPRKPHTPTKTRGGEKVFPQGNYLMSH